jgi:hypothetical protein
MADSTPEHDLFGNVITPEEWWIFHDESGNIGNSKDRWVVIALLFINLTTMGPLYSRMIAIRNAADYWGKIHFCEFPESFRGEFSKKPCVGKKWFQVASQFFGKGIKYFAVAIDQKHDKFEWHRFSERFHAYNRFTAISFKASLSWLFHRLREIQVRIYSDKKIERPKNDLAILNSDNFHDYLQRRISDDTSPESYKGPKVILLDKIRSLTFKNIYNKNNVPPPELEFLQLSDVMTSAVAEAVYPKSKREAKTWFAKQMALILNDSRKKPWNQEFDLHRNFCISYFPDKRGKFHGNGPLGIFEGKDEQSSLF